VELPADGEASGSGGPKAKVGGAVPTADAEGQEVAKKEDRHLMDIVT